MSNGSGHQLINTRLQTLSLGNAGDISVRDCIDDADLSGLRRQGSANSPGIEGGHCDNDLLPPEYDDVGVGLADGPGVARSPVHEQINRFKNRFNM